MTQQGIEVEQLCYEDLFNNAPNAYIVTDGQTAILLANDQAQDLLRLPQESLLKQLLSRFLAQPDRLLFMSKRDQLLTSRQALAFESRLELLDHTQVAVAIRVSACPGAEGCKMFCWSIREIDQAKQTEAQLQLQAQVLCQTHNPVISTDLEGYITSWNRGSERLFGYSTAEAMGEHISLLYPHPEMREMLQRQIIAPLKAKGEQEIEIRVQCKSGDRIDLLLSLSLLRDQYQNPSGMIGVAMDITERKQTEAILRQSEEFKRRLLESSSDCIKVLDLDGRLIYMNEGGLCLLEIDDLVPFLNTEWISLWPDAAQQQALSAITAAKAGQSARFQSFCPTAKGAPKWWDVVVTPVLNTTGQVDQLLVTSRDITERRDAEEQLRQVNEQLILSNAELYRATRLKDGFLANMSHELRTPLNAILGMTEGLQDEMFGPLSDRQKSAIDTIEHSGQHLLELINDILDLAKIESGKLELQLAPVSVNHLCTSSVAFIRQQAIAKNIQLTTELPFGLPGIWVDELRMRQVLINLLNNAVKFTAAGGIVKLVVQQEQVQEQQFLNFAVIDTGIGIAQTDIDKLFQPFVQIDSQFNRKHTGTGLGLSLVQRLVELHHGTIAVISTLGQGSCFTVRLPYQIDHTNKTSPEAVAFRQQLYLVNDLAQDSNSGMASRSQSQLLNAQILLVEDNEVNAVTLISYLEGRGYRLMLATNGQDAIHLAIKHQPDLILMDIQMSGMDGLEAIRRMRSHIELVDTPIIAVTALAMSSDRERCLAVGANDYITKPVKLKQLIFSIQRLLKKNTEI